MAELIVALGEHVYSVQRPWGSVPRGHKLAFVSQIAVDPDGCVYLCQRADPPIVVFDSSGAYLRSWGTGVIADAHGIFIDHEGRVYVVDRDAHQVLRFDSAGRCDMTLGERSHPRFQEPFNHPTDIAVAPNGDIYVTDGYGNSAVHCFSVTGEWKESWGCPGKGPGEFTTPHAVWVDSHNRVLVADRENDRIQIFDLRGSYLEEWSDVYRPMDIFVDKEDRIYVTDQIPRLSMFSTAGKLVGRCRPVLYGAHGIWGDADGNLYLAESSPMDRITKLVKQ